MNLVLEKDYYIVSLTKYFYDTILFTFPAGEFHCSQEFYKISCLPFIKFLIFDKKNIIHIVFQYWSQ